jgi:DNA-binding transcriptional LysR family regulator
VASPIYLVAQGTPTRPAELANHKTINVRLRDGLEPSWTIRERIAIAGSPNEPVTFLPKSGLTIENHDSALDAAIAGLGIALVLKQAAQSHLRTGVLRPVLPGCDSQLTNGSKVFLLYPSKKYLPARVRVFIDFLVHISRRDGWSGAAAQETPAEPRAASMH